jgi:hypothetical protein
MPTPTRLRDRGGRGRVLAAAQVAGCARAAAVPAHPPRRVRDWLRAVARAAPQLTARAVTVAQIAGDADACWPRPSRPVSALAGAVNALAAAPRAFPLSLARPVPPSPGGPLTGIDYLAIVAERQRRSLPHRVTAGRSRRRGRPRLALADDQRDHRRAAPHHHQPRLIAGATSRPARPLAAGTGRVGRHGEVERPRWQIADVTMTTKPPP